MKKTKPDDFEKKVTWAISVKESPKPLRDLVDAFLNVDQASLDVAMDRIAIWLNEGNDPKRSDLDYTPPPIAIIGPNAELLLDHLIELVYRVLKKREGRLRKINEAKKSKVTERIRFLEDESRKLMKDLKTKKRDWSEEVIRACLRNKDRDHFKISYATARRDAFERLRLPKSKPRRTIRG